MYPEQTSCGYRKLTVSYYTRKPHLIMSDITYLLSRRKPAGGFIPYSRYTLSRTRGLDRRVVWRENTNTYLFALKICACAFYTNNSKYLQLQATRTGASCPVEGEFGRSVPETRRQSSRDHCRISEFERQSDRDRTKGKKTKNLFTRVL